MPQQTTARLGDCSGGVIDVWLCSTRLELASNHASLREAVEALTASSLQSIEVEADEVAFVDASGACAGSRCAA
jgi:hypothetical protein